ncbi:MAG TPA: mandelate racemase/muconate lactonizing enzyme family protein [Candidatus Ruania gallistercoris]|uniref:Mandelate racemase/muconate lactonizing enzyme family protein n=1 Tax=Candidatus Ruania gallistercoris TaxID=2838746 RepID=A0A9D2J5U9_9MICO|nr:mandelate racemase/muconate lactonizing enzyme family protein [Candidatus Ruania gallistercoris]
MKIDRIDTLVRGPIAVVRVRTACGIEGIGQTAPYQANISAQVLHQMVAPWVLGRDPWDVEALVDEILLRHYKFSGGFLQRAVAGIDTALWDVLGQATGQPVAKLIGGHRRATVPMYGSSMVRHTSPEEEVERLLGAVEKYGFEEVKLRVGEVMGADSDASPGRTERLIPAARAELGEHVAICADANGGYSPGRAIQIGRLLEQFDYSHFEEPCDFQDLDGTAYVCRALDIPVAGGEQDSSLPQFHRMLSQRAVDIVQPDIGYLGGISRARRVALMAEAAGVPCTPHCANDSLLQVFTLHLATAMPACTRRQEWSIEATGWTEGVYGPALEIADGEVSAPTRPGWGIELDPAFLRSATITTSR